MGISAEDVAFICAMASVEEVAFNYSRSVQPNACLQSLFKYRVP